MGNLTRESTAQEDYEAAENAHWELLTSLAMLQEMFERCDGEFSLSASGAIGISYTLKRCQMLAAQVDPHAIVQAAQQEGV